MLCLTKEDIIPLVQMEDALGFAEESYRLQGQARKKEILAQFSPLVAYEVHSRSVPPGFFDFRSGYVEKIPILISTMGYGYPENRSTRGLPGVFAYSLLSDIETGAPLAIMEADHLCSMRTGAAGAIASKYLARKESQSIAMIGTGHLATNMLDAHMKSEFPIKDVRVWSRSAENRERFANAASRKYNVQSMAAKSPAEAVQAADIICCCTPSKEPLVIVGDIKPGVHINAFGADSPGKQEVDSQVLLKSDKLVVDDLEQCALGGEIHKGLRSGQLSKEKIYAEIGEIVLGEKPGRTKENEITLMDGTGLASQDLVIFYNTYMKARQHQAGKWIDL